jgi:hypothetical protein
MLKIIFLEVKKILSIKKALQTLQGFFKIKIGLY